MWYRDCPVIAWRRACRRHVARSVLTAFFLAIGLWLSAQASGGTVGYWRFEDSPGFLNDSGLNNLNLSTSSTAPTQYTLPATGKGSKFHDPIPRTGDANAEAADFGNSAGRYLYHVDNDDFVVTDFTIEAYIHKETSTTTTQYIASQWGASRSWAFFAFGSAVGTPYDLSLLLSDTGSDSNIIASGIDIAVGKDYYVAASFDQSNTSTGVTFYVQNLTDGGALQSVSKPHDILSLNNSTEDFRMGYNGNWTGLIDEERLSNVVLDRSELLSTPEPATVVLLAAGLIAALLLPRRGRHG